MNPVTFLQFRTWWMLLITSCLLSGASDDPSPDNAFRRSNGEPVGKLEKVTAKTSAANSGETAPRMASGPPFENATKLNEYIVSSSRVSEIAASVSSPVANHHGG
jgi:hypothetical protein